MHVIDRTDAFTLVGADARRGKLTLFAAEGPRERGALKHVALRVVDLDRRSPRCRTARARAPREGEAYFELGEGVRIGLVEAPTDVEYDLDHVALCSAEPGGDGGRVRVARLRRRPRPAPSGCPRVEVGGAWVEFHPGEPGRAGAAAAQPPRRARRLGGRARSPPRTTSASRSTTSSTRRTRYAVFLCGPGARPHRVRRAQADVLADLARCSIAGAGMAGLVAAARARELGLEPRVAREGRRAPAARCCSRAASSGATASGTTSAPSVPAATRRCSGSSGSGSTTRSRWLVSLGAEPVVGRHREPAHDRQALRPARAHGAARGRGTSSSRRRSPRDARAAARPRDRRLRQAARRASAACSCARTRGATGDGARLRARARRCGRPRDWTSSTAARCRRRPARIREEDFVPLAQLYGREARVFTDDGREITPPSRRVARERPRAAHRPARVVRRRREHERADRGGARRRRHGRRRARRRPRSRVARDAAAGDAHDRRPPRRHARARRRRSTASGPRASTRAASRRAATRAASRRRSCSASRPPRIAAGALGRAEVRAERACRRGSGDGATFVTRSVLARRRSTSAPTAGTSPSCSRELVAGGLPDEEEVRRRHPSARILLAAAA